MKNIKRASSLALVAFLLAAGCATAGSMKVVLPESQLIRPEPVGTSALEKKMQKATAMLYGMSEGGDMRFTCTVTAFERDRKNPKLYRFDGASHCVAEDDTKKQRVVLAPNHWYLLFKESKIKKFYRANVVAAGYQSRGDDLAILEAELDYEIPVIPLAEKDGITGESICAVMAPYGLGKQLFRGHVSMPKVNRPIKGRQINWEGVTLLQSPSGPGASGSSIVSVSRQKIIAILVGRIGRSGSTPSIATMPISRFHKFRKMVKRGEYRWLGTQQEDSNYKDILFGDENMLDRIIKTIEKFHGGPMTPILEK